MESEIAVIVHEQRYRLGRTHVPEVHGIDVRYAILILDRRGEGHRAAACRRALDR